MKTGTSRHPKTIDLCLRMNIPKWQAVGILECLWEFACEFSPQGDIGKWPNKQIAASIGWGDDPDELVRNLTESGWIDNDETHRLVIHDWKEHAPKFVKERLKYKGLTFIVAESAGIRQNLPDSEHKPNPTQPKQTQPKHTDTVTPDDAPGFDSFWIEYPKKVGKLDARRAWKKAKMPGLEVVLSALRSQVSSSEWTREGGRFIPNPATWINQGRWDDQLTPEKPVRVPASASPATGSTENPTSQSESHGGPPAPGIEAMLRRFNIPISPAEASELSLVELSCVVELFSLPQRNGTIRSPIGLAKSIAKNTGSKPKFDRIVKGYLHPAPASGVCECGGVLEKYYAPGSGQAGMSCPNCKADYPRV